MNETYVPRSPDLSALHATAATSNPHSLHPHQQPQQPQYASHTSTPGPYHHNRGPSPPPPYKQSSDPAQHSAYHSPPSDFRLPPSNPPFAQQQQSYHPHRPQQHFDPRFQPYTMPRPRKAAHPEDDYLPQPHQQQYSYTPQNHSTQPSFAAQEPPTKPPPGQAEGVVVKTKFPVARIKRIVQADEDVGKVAQSTPVAVSKALELFMISLALGSAAVARERGSKKVTGACLKAAVARGDQFDFLQDTVSKIQDGGDKNGGAGGAARKGREASESEDKAESDEEYGTKKKAPAKPRKRRKKSETDDDD